MQKECTEEELGSWAELLSKWKDVALRPRQLPGLVRKVGLFLRMKSDRKTLVRLNLAILFKAILGLC